MSKRGLAVTSIFATVGVILISLGVLWMLASNWQIIPAPVKIIILLLAVAISYIIATQLEDNYPKLSQTMYMLTGILWTLSLFLVAQIFHLEASFQGSANILLLALIGTVTLAYLVRATGALVVAILNFWAWVWVQTISTALTTVTYTTNDFSVLLVAFVLSQLAVTGTLLGVSLLHRAFDRSNASKVFTWWAAFAMLITGFLLSNQSTQHALVGFWQLPGLLLFPRVIIPAVILILGMYFALNRVKISKFDAYSGAWIWGGYIVAISVLPIFLGLSPVTNYYESFFDLGAPYIIQWIIFNALFITLFITLLNFAVRERRQSLAQLSIFAFIIYLAARYIGFIIDLSGYLAISTMFIAGGVGLIALAFIFAKLRKNALQRIR